MSSIKRLAGQTAIYGVPSILGRILNYLLVPFYTRVFVPEAFGTYSFFYSCVAFLMVMLTYGMETAFFRYYDKENELEKEKVFSTGVISLIFTSTIFLVIVSWFAGPIASFIDYANYKIYVIWFAWILALDAISSMPFARLRAQNKAKKFAFIKMLNIVVNILLNFFFILFCPYIINNYSDSFIADGLRLIYRSDWGIEYAFISNLIASVITVLLLLPEILSTKWKVYPDLWKKMLIYAFPLLFAGLAGIVNETFDRILLRYLLPKDIATAQVGIYSACYKISILMTIFIQAYKYAAEPFFFSHAKEKDAKIMYARIMDYFIIVVALIFLGTMVYLDDFVLRLLIGPEYREGRRVIPILMLANLFLGVYYNLSIWYKLADKTIWGAWLAIIGATITLILNFWWIPLSSQLIGGYMGSAWATFICYASMMILSYIIGQRFFPIKYNLKKFFGYLGLSFALYLISILVIIKILVLSILFHTMLILIFLAVVYLIEKPNLKTFIR